MGIDLPLIWAVIILFGVMMYVVMDGFDLGIGILFTAVREEANRDVMMNTVAPVWDGNETWLVLGGAGLLVAFPVAYAVVLSALYLPLIFMLIGLIFRGVAFEFRFKASPRRRHFWDKSFIGGSLTAAFFQGVTLGSFIEGIPVQNDIFVGDPLDWLAPFPLFVGAGLVVAYALLGSTWLVMKTGGLLHERMRRASARLALALVAVIAVISVWTPLAQPLILERWFSMPNLLWFSPVPLLVLLVTFALRRSLAARRRRCVAFRVDPRAGVSRLHRPRHQRVAERDPAHNDHLGRRRPARRALASRSWGRCSSSPSSSCTRPGAITSSGGR